jgi:hypothetical protein
MRDYYEETYGLEPDLLKVRASALGIADPFEAVSCWLRAISMDMTDVFPAPVANSSARRISSGFDCSFAPSTCSQNFAPRAPDIRATSYQPAKRCLHRRRRGADTVPSRAREIDLARIFRLATKKEAGVSPQRP